MIKQTVTRTHPTRSGPMNKMPKVNYDRETKAWLNSHIEQQTTVCLCDKCGLFYKPSLEHKCKKK